MPMTGLKISVVSVINTLLISFFEKKMWKIVGDSGEFTIFAAKFHFSHFEVTKIHAVHW